MKTNKTNIIQQIKQLKPANFDSLPITKQLTMMREIVNKAHKLIVQNYTRLNTLENNFVKNDKRCIALKQKMCDAEKAENEARKQKEKLVEAYRSKIYKQFYNDDTTIRSEIVEKFQKKYPNRRINELVYTIDKHLEEQVSKFEEKDEESKRLAKLVDAQDALYWKLSDKIDNLTSQATKALLKQHEKARDLAFEYNEKRRIIAATIKDAQEEKRSNKADEEEKISIKSLL